VNLIAQRLKGIGLPTPLGGPQQLLSASPINTMQRPALAPHEHFDHRHAIPQVRLHSGQSQLPSRQLHSPRVQLDYIQAASVKAGRQRTVIVASRLDPDPNIQGAPDSPPVDPDPLDQPFLSRDRQVELERTADQLAVAVGDQRHGAVLADIDWHHQTPLRVKPSDQRHVLGLSSTTSESHRQDLLDSIGPVSLIATGFRTEDPL
jgi:hypothetical protein